MSSGADYFWFACGIKIDGLVVCWGDDRYSGRTIPPEYFVFKHEVIPTTPDLIQADLDAS